MNARTTGAICMGPTGNRQGGHYFLNLSTGDTIVRHRWTVLPMPQDVIDRISALGSTQRMPLTLTFADRHGRLIPDQLENLAAEDFPDDDDSDSDYADPANDDDDDDDSDDDDDDDDLSTHEINPPAHDSSAPPRTPGVKLVRIEQAPAAPALPPPPPAGITGVELALEDEHLPGVHNNANDNNHHPTGVDDEIPGVDEQPHEQLDEHAPPAEDQVNQHDDIQEVVPTDNQPLYFDYEEEDDADDQELHDQARE